MSSVSTCAIHNTFYKRNGKKLVPRELLSYISTFFKNTREVREALASRFLFAIEKQRLQHIDAKLKFSVNPKPKN